MSIVDKLKEKYKVELARTKVELDTQWKSSQPTKDNKSENIDANDFLMKKWKHRIKPKWYGFAYEGPLIWAKIIDEFLLILEKKCPNFQILQIKSKYHWIAIYLELNTTDPSIEFEIEKNIEALEKLFQHPNLAY